MKQNRKRLLSWLLVLVMVFSLAPASAFANADAVDVGEITFSCTDTDSWVVRVYQDKDLQQQEYAQGNGVFYLFPGT